MTRAEAAVVAELIRRKNKLVTVFEVFVNEVVEQRPFQSCANASVNPETVARKFYASFVVDQAEIRADVDVIFERKIEFGLFTDDFDDLVVFLFAGKQIGVGNVGHTGKRVVDFCNEVVYLCVAIRDFVAEFSHFVKYRFDGLTRFFENGDLRRNLIFLRFELFDSGYGRLSLVIPFDDLGKVRGVTFLCKSVNHLLRIVSDSCQIQHSIFL